MMNPGEAEERMRTLVEQHYGLLYRFAYRLCGSAADAEDLTQQTFLAAQSHLSQLRDERLAKSWLCTILRRCFLKSARKATTSRLSSLESMEEIEGRIPEVSPFDPEALQAALNSLPEEFRTPLILFYFQEFSYKEIAEQLQTPVGTVMSRLSRGKTYLRRALSKEGECPPSLLDS